MLKSGDELPLEHARRIGFGQCVADLRDRTLLRDNQAVHLQPKSFALLEALLLRAGQLMTKEEILAQVWPGQVVTDHALTRAVKEIRRALDDDAHHPRYIETVPRLGYRFIAKTSTAPAEGAQAQPTHAGRRWFWPALAAAALLATGLLWWVARDLDQAGIETDARTDTVALNSDRFEAQGWQLLSRRGPGLAGAVDAFEKALEKDPRHARAMAGLAIAVMLSFSGEVMSEDIDTRLRQLLDQAAAIEPGLGRADAALGLYALREGRLADAESHLRRAISQDPDFADSYSWLASVLYARGRLNESIEMRRQALKLDPLNATLTGNLAMALAAAGDLDQALQLIDSHQQLPNGFEPMVYPRTVIAITRGELATAARVFREYLGKTPGSPYGHQALAGLLLQVGRNAEAKRLMDQAAGRICLGPSRQFGMRAGYLQAEARYPELARWAAEQRQVLGDRTWVIQAQARAALAQSDPDQVIDLLGPRYLGKTEREWASESLVGDALDIHLLATAMMQRGGDPKALLQAVDQGLQARFDNGYRDHAPLLFIKARNEALRGRVAPALDALEAAVAAGWLHANELSRDPLWSSLAGEPGFASIVRKVEQRIADQVAAMQEDGLFQWLAQFEPPTMDCSRR